MHDDGNFIIIIIDKLGYPNLFKYPIIPSFNPRIS